MDKRTLLEQVMSDEVKSEARRMYLDNSSVTAIMTTDLFRYKKNLGNGHQAMPTVHSLNPGHFYIFQINVVSSANRYIMIGVGQDNPNWPSNSVGYTAAKQFGFYLHNGNIHKSGTLQPCLSSFNVGDVATFVVDMDENGTFTVFKNKLKQGTVMCGLSNMKKPKFVVTLYQLNDIVTFEGYQFKQRIIIPGL